MRRKRIFLYGALGDFGTHFDLAITTPVEAISAIGAQCDEFCQQLRHGHYLVFAGGRRRRRGLAGPDLAKPFPEYHLHIMPALTGRGKNDGKLLLGLSLLGLSFVPGVQASLSAEFARFGSTIGGAGFGELAGDFGSKLLGGAASWLILSSASETLAPQPRNLAGQVRSDSFNLFQQGAEGQPIPMIYGRVRVESPPVISASLEVSKIDL